MRSGYARARSGPCGGEPNTSARTSDLRTQESHEMDFTKQIEANRRALIADLFRRIEQALDPFAFALDWFLADLFRSRLPADWRGRWHAFVEEQAEHGFFVEPRSVRELEAWIEAWARYCGLLPVATQPKADPPAKREGVVRPVAAVRPTQQAIQEQFFDQQLATAQGHLDELERLLDALGARLDAAKIGEAVDVDREADQVEELIWRYHDALESARDAWLRDDLKGDENTRLLQMRTPASLGLPLFLDDQQAERARRQEARISGRLGARNVTIDRIVAGMNAVEFAGNVAGFAVGAGVVIKAAKTGGRWAVVKTIAVGGAFLTAEQAAEKGLHAAGAGEQTIRGVRLAVAVITLILLRRKSASVSNESPASTESTPLPATEVPVRGNPQPLQPEARGPIKNPSGNLDDAARTQPHGPARQPPSSKKSRLPTVGTPERAAIEAARRQGIRAARAKELEEIRAGGSGSGVWSELELTEIRKTGKFPADVRWHHDPTVANSPVLAADPSAVRPVRGGTQGHLDAHGGDFRKPFSSEQEQ